MSGDEVSLMKRKLLLLKLREEERTAKKLDIFEQRRIAHLKSIIDENGVNLYEEAVKFWKSPQGIEMIRKSRENRNI